MQQPAKPVSETYRPELTRLARLTPARRVFRWLMNALARLAAWLFTRPLVRGMENIPPEGPGIIVSNHLGDADFVLGLAYTPRQVETLAKSELYDFPLLGWLMDAYGVIWLHRGRADRRALRVALQALAEGRMVAVAPEGRESVTGALEEGTNGAAFLALKSGAPLIPVTFTGTENATVFANIKRFRRTPVTLTVGPPFTLDPDPDRHSAVEDGTRTIMTALAHQLPPEYRGVYHLDTE